MGNDSEAKIVISIDIELSDDEVLAIKHFRTSEDGLVNFYSMGMRWRDVATSLQVKGIVDGLLSTTYLTYVGKILFDRCDRNKKLENLLND